MYSLETFRAQIPQPVSVLIELLKKKKKACHFNSDWEIIIGSSDLIQVPTINDIFIFLDTLTLIFKIKPKKKKKSLKKVEVIMIVFFLPSNTAILFSLKMCLFFIYLWENNFFENDLINTLFNYQFLKE